MEMIAKSQCGMYEMTHWLLFGCRQLLGWDSKMCGCQ